MPWASWPPWMRWGMAAVAAFYVASYIVTLRGALP